MEDIISHTENRLRDYAVNLDWFQSNHEGEIVEKIHQGIEERVDGIAINPGGFAHTSVAIHDALKIFSGSVVEVHLTNTARREDFRSSKVTAQAVRATLEGHGKESYFLAVISLII